MDLEQVRDRASRVKAPRPRLPQRLVMPAAVAGTLLLTAGPTHIEAKVPGQTHCYKTTCHRVKTIAETQRLVGRTATETASFYDFPELDRFNRGRLTSNGEVFDAASDEQVSSSHFPDGTELLLWNPENGRTAHVRVNDFGPFHTNRTLDVTRGVATRLGFLKKGVTPIQVTVIAAPGPDDIGYQRNRRGPRMRGYIDVLSREEVRVLIPQLITEAEERHREAMMAMAEEDVPLPSRPSWAVVDAEDAEPAPDWANVLPDPARVAASRLPLVVPAPRPADAFEVAASLPLPRFLDTATTAPLVVPRPRPASASEVAANLPLPRFLAAATTAPLVVPRPRPASAIEVAANLPAISFGDRQNQARLAFAASTAVTAAPASAPAPVVLAEAPQPPVAGALGGAVLVAQPAPRASEPPITAAMRDVGATAELADTSSSLKPFRLSPQAFVMSLAALMLGWTLIAMLASRRRWPVLVRAGTRAVHADARSLDEQLHRAFDTGAADSDQATADSYGDEPVALLPLAAPPPPVVSQLHAGLRVTGQISSQAKLVLMGQVDGEIIGEEVVIEDGALVTGFISARTLLVRGTVDGRIRAHHVAIEGNGLVSGELAFFTLALAETARLEASCRRVGEPTQIATLDRARLQLAAA